MGLPFSVFARLLKLAALLKGMLKDKPKCVSVCAAGENQVREEPNKKPARAQLSKCFDFVLAVEFEWILVLCVSRKLNTESITKLKVRIMPRRQHLQKF